MGCDCVNYLPSKTSKKEVGEFLKSLGYIKIPKSIFSRKGTTELIYHPDDYKYFTGIYAELSLHEVDGLIVHTRTSIWRSRYDTDFHNYTIKQLRKRFGGYFDSDNGKNRYLISEHPYIENEEAGCYQAYSRFFENIKRIKYTLDTWLSSKTDMDWSSKEIGKWFALDLFNPLIATVNMAIPFIVSMIEDYFRSTYITLLKYSPQKDVIIRDCRIHGEDLVLLAKGDISVEDTIARSRSFQNMRRIAQSFKELDIDIDLYGILQKPFRRRKQSIFSTFEQIIILRHGIIHRAELVFGYTPQTLLKDIHTIHTGIERFYLSLIKLYDWSDEHPDLHDTI